MNWGLELGTTKTDADGTLPVADDLARAESYLRIYRPWDNRLLIASILFSTLASALAAGAAATGNAATDVFGGWRPLCCCVAGLSFVGTVAGAIHKGLGITERVAEAQQCIAALKSLSLMASFEEPQKAVEQLAQIRQRHSRVLSSVH